MQVHFHAADALAFDTPLLALAVPSGASASEGALARADRTLGGAVARAFASGDLKGAAKDEVVLYAGDDGPRRVVLLGVGKASDFDAEQMRRFAARAVRVAERLGVTSVAVSLEVAGAALDAASAQGAAEGAVLAAWRFTELKRPPEEGLTRVERADLFAQEDEGGLAEAVRVGGVVARAQNVARALQARPGNVATPSHLAAEAERIAEAHGLVCTVFDEARML